MTDMISKVARAIRDVAYTSGGKCYLISPGEAATMAKAALSALEEHGLVIVPREPTPPMQARGSDALGIEGIKSVTSYGAAGRVWQAMLAALEGK